MVDFVEICRQETDIAFPPLEPELTQSFDHNEDIRSIYGMFLQPLVPNTILVLKVIYSKHSKHWPYTVAHTIGCVCNKMLNHGTNYGHPERKQPSLHGRKFNPNPKFLGTAKAYLVCHIGPIFQISLIYAFIGCPQSVVPMMQHVCICVVQTKYKKRPFGPYNGLPWPNDSLYLFV